MRILHIVHQYPPDDTGGTELYTQALAHALARRGHAVGVFYRHPAGNPGLSARQDGPVTVWMAGSHRPNPAGRFLSTLHQPGLREALARALADSRPDVVHVQHLMGLPANVLADIKAAGVPFVLTLHDYWWICANAQLLTNYSAEICDGPALYANCARCALARMNAGPLWPMLPGLAALLAWRNAMLRNVLEAAGRIIAPSDFVKRWYAAHGVEGNRIRVLQHGIETQPALAAHRPSDGVVRFAAIGGIAWQKGLHILIDAFSQVQGPAELWIAGAEGQEPGYARRLREQAGPNVRFLGPLARAQVWEALGQIDALVVPSLWHETFSLIAHEAQAVGVPVVAAATGALTEAVRDGVDGLLVPPGDVRAWHAALQRLVDDRAVLEELRSHVRPPMSLEQHVDLVEAIYRQLGRGQQGE